MSIATEIEKIQGSRNTIRSKLVTMGLATSADKLETLATTINNIPIHNAVNATVKQGEAYSIPAGYHDGSGTVTGLDNPAEDAAKYQLQAKTVTPEKKTLTVTPDQGNYGLSSVTVEPIPDDYQNVSSVTATTADVLTGKVFVPKSGTPTAGTMANNGAVNKVLDATKDSSGKLTNTIYTIPVGYHNGSGKVRVSYETPNNVTPSKQPQTVTAAEGAFMDKVIINPIPDEYITTDDANATAGDMLYGKTAYVNGVKVTGNIQEATRAETVLNVNADEDDSSTIYLSAKNDQGTGYISTASNKTASKTLKLSASGKTVSVTDSSGDTVYGSADVASVEKVSGSINGMTTTTFTQEVNKFVGIVEVTLTDDIENALKEI